jgi:hypothetical protein
MTPRKKSWTACVHFHHSYTTDRHDLNNARNLLLFTLVNNPFSLLTYKPNVLAVAGSNRCCYIMVDPATLSPLSEASHYCEFLQST